MILATTNMSEGDYVIGGDGPHRLFSTMPNRGQRPQGIPVLHIRAFHIESVPLGSLRVLEPVSIEPSVVGIALPVVKHPGE